MSTLDKQLYIDAVVVLGIGRNFTISINTRIDDSEQLTIGNNFAPMNLTGYKIRFKVLGSARGDGTVLLEKIVTEDSNSETVGVIEEPESGEFSLIISSDDTNLLGLGEFPICLQILDENDDVIYTLTEGGIAQGEFNKITIVRV